MPDITEIFIQNYKLLYRIIYKKTNNVEDAKDIMQETFIKAYKYNKPGRPLEEILPWLVAIAKHELDSYYSKTILTDSIEDYENFGMLTSEKDYSEVIFMDTINRYLQVVPEDIRNILKKNLIDEIPLKRLAKTYNISAGRLRYWHTVFVNKVTTLIKKA